MTTALFGVRSQRSRAGDIDVPLLVGERSGKRGFWPFGSRASVTLPLHERVSGRFFPLVSLSTLSVIAGIGFVIGGQYDAFRASQGELHHVAARAVGLGMDRITISGLMELDEHEVLQAAGINPRGSLAFFDVSEARQRLEAQPLIREANVRKLYPGELTIQLKEREAFALWQLNGEISIISSDGTVIDKMRDGRFAHLPLVVGPGANKRVRDYVVLLAEAGSLKKEIRGATLVSERRWTLKLQNGLDVRLPEENADEAVRRLARLAREQKLIDKDIISIDMRQPDRVTVRLTEEAAAARAEMLKNRPKPKGGQA
ncbi:MAG: cell division protein FtsQ/DivIB [Bosea sp. (in: a-proteobacteria)]